MDRDLEREAWDKARLSLSLSPSLFFSLLLDGILKRGARCRIDHTICKNRDKTSSSFDLGILVANSSSVNNRKLSKGTILRETLNGERSGDTALRSDQLIPPLKRNKSRSYRNFPC